jgi:YbgC/YbaW family acyl-CoA thioester hydrolase
MPCEFTLRRRVEFSETDMAGLMHFSNFFRFMEAAEHAFLRSLGLSVDLRKHAPGLCLPRVHAACDYRAPLRFEDEVEIQLRVAQKTARSLTYDFCFRRSDGKRSIEVAHGTLAVVCAQRRPDGTLKAVPLPGVLADRLQVASAARAKTRSSVSTSR